MLIGLVAERAAGSDSNPPALTLLVPTIIGPATTIIAATVKASALLALNSTGTRFFIMRSIRVLRLEPAILDPWTKGEAKYTSQIFRMDSAYS